jgi:hypothetical protein
METGIRAGVYTYSRLHQQHCSNILESKNVEKTEELQLIAIEAQKTGARARTFYNSD